MPGSLSGPLRRPPRWPFRRNGPAAETRGSFRPGSAPRSLALPAMLARASAAETAVPGGVVAQRPQEVDPAEVGPVDVGEVELGVRRLPEQEARQPLLTAGPDDQVGIGLAAGVEVLGDVVDLQRLDQLVQRR